MNVTAELARTTLAHAYNYACFRAQHAATIDAWTRSLQTSDPATRRRVWSWHRPAPTPWA